MDISGKHNLMNGDTLVFILSICSVCSSGLEEEKLGGRGGTGDRSAEEGGGVRVSNLWFRGGRVGGVAALLVSAEHKLP